MASSDSGSGSGSGSGSRVVVHMKVPFSKVSQNGRVACTSAQTVAARLRCAALRFLLCHCTTTTTTLPRCSCICYWLLLQKTIWKSMIEKSTFDTTLEALTTWKQMVRRKKGRRPEGVAVVRVGVGLAVGAEVAQQQWQQHGA